jgi:hypothetical protein
VFGDTPDCPVCQQSNDYFKRNGRLQHIKCAPARAEVRAHAVGAPDSLQYLLKGKCALGPFLSILVIECQLKCLNVNSCLWMDKVQIKSKGMFLSLSTLVLCTNTLV